jgi:hypothetical protein
MSRFPIQGWRSSMQTNPEQPIEAGKVVHVGMRYKST